MGLPLMHISDTLLWRQKFTCFSREHGNETNTENWHNASKLCITFTGHLSLQAKKIKELL